MERTGTCAFKPSFPKLSCAKQIWEEFAPKLHQRTYRELRWSNQMAPDSPRAMLHKIYTTELTTASLVLVHRYNHCKKKKKVQRRNSALLIFISHWFQASSSSVQTQALHKLHTRNTDCTGHMWKPIKQFCKQSYPSCPIRLWWCQHAPQPQLFTLSPTTLSRNHQFSELL